MEIARSVRISGRVQGVFFRAWSRDQARSLGVAGWIRNCSDGTVEAHVEGEPDLVDKLIGRLRSGPPVAQVDRLDIEDATIEGLAEFDVRR